MKIMRKGKHTMTHHFMQEIISKHCEKGIGAIVEGFTCLAAQIAQSLALEGLENYPTSARLVNGNVGGEEAARRRGVATTGAQRWECA
jgi:hypothetical protein